MKITELLNRIDKYIADKITGPKPYDKNTPDKRPVNSARERMKRAEIITSIHSKERALAVITEARANRIADFDFSQSFWAQIEWSAIKQAVGWHATNEEIQIAQHAGDIRGAELKSGLNR